MAKIAARLLINLAHPIEGWHKMNDLDRRERITDLVVRTFEMFEEHIGGLIKNKDNLPEVVSENATIDTIILDPLNPYILVRRR